MTHGGCGENRFGVFGDTSLLRIIDEDEANVSPRHCRLRMTLHVTLDEAEVEQLE
jgi:hypothetical protein